MVGVITPSSALANSVLREEEVQTDRDGMRNFCHHGDPALRVSPFCSVENHSYLLRGGTGRGPGTGRWGQQQWDVGGEADSGSCRGALLKTQTDRCCLQALHGLPWLSCPSSVALPVSPGTLILALGDDR